jgi:hypothetical protein
MTSSPVLRVLRVLPQFTRASISAPSSSSIVKSLRQISGESATCTSEMAPRIVWLRLPHWPRVSHTPPDYHLHQTVAPPSINLHRAALQSCRLTLPDKHAAIGPIPNPRREQDIYNCQGRGHHSDITHLHHRLMEPKTRVRRKRRPMASSCPAGVCGPLLTRVQ